MAKARPASGLLQNGAVEVMDPQDATRLYSHGLGTPRSGNTLLLDAVEAAYAVASERLTVQADGAKLSWHALLQQGPEGDSLEVPYLAYCDLRDRGLLTRPAADGGFHVWARGASLKDVPWLRVRPMAERTAATPAQLVACAQGDEILALVDEDGCVTHYRSHEVHPRGDVARSTLPEAPGVVLQDRVLVLDRAAAQAMHGGEHIGTPHGDSVILSLVEAEALRRRGPLQVEALAPLGRRRQERFDAILATYEHLRQEGVLARSGFRFGTHLRGYRTDPDREHAQWLIQCQGPDEPVAWSNLSRAVRLAHGVRKEFLLAVVEEARVRYVGLSWFRP